LELQEKELQKQQAELAVEAKEAELIKQNLVARKIQIESEKIKMGDVKKKLTSDHKYFIEKPKDENYEGIVYYYYSSCAVY
jgi:hypothetical protein